MRFVHIEPGQVWRTRGDGQWRHVDILACDEHTNDPAATGPRVSVFHRETRRRSRLNAATLRAQWSIVAPTNAEGSPA